MGMDQTDSRDQLYKVGLPGKSILWDCFQENMTSQRPFLFLRISFPGRPILYNCLQVDLDSPWITLVDAPHGFLKEVYIYLVSWSDGPRPWSYSVTTSPPTIGRGLPLRETSIHLGLEVQHSSKMTQSFSLAAQLYPSGTSWMISTG